MSALESGTLRATYKGERQGVWPATHPQANVWDWLSREDSEHISTLFAMVPVPDATPMERVAEALEALVSRHESLRTVYHPDAAGLILQKVLGEGAFDARILEAAGEDMDRFEAACVETFPVSFRLSEEIPLRAAVLTEAGAPVRVLLQLSHIAADRTACTILQEDLADALAGEPLADAPTRQPVDQALIEDSDSGRERMERTLRYWADQLSRHPLCLMSVPRIGDGGAYHHGELRSATLGADAAAVAERCSATVPSVLIAAVSAVVGTWTGNRTGLVYVTVANRAHRHLKRYVGTIAQEAVVPYDLDEPSVARFVTALHGAAMNAYAHGAYDSRRLSAVVDATAFGRGLERHRDCVINIEREDGRSYPPQESSVSMSEGYLYEEELRFDVRISETGIGLSLNANGDYVPEPQVPQLLLAVERILSAAAMATDGPPDLLAADMIEPPRRGDDWIVRDGAWLNPAEVRAVLDQTFGPGRTALDTGGSALTAAVPADLLDAPPEELRTRFHRLMSGRHATAVPDRFTPMAPAPRTAA
jgi:hypothetical protein